MSRTGAGMQGDRCKLVDVRIYKKYHTLNAGENS